MLLALIFGACIAFLVWFFAVIQMKHQQENVFTTSDYNYYSRDKHSIQFNGVTSDGVQVIVDYTTNIPYEDEEVEMINKQIRKVLLKMTSEDLYDFSADDIVRSTNFSEYKEKTVDE